ncbi:MAG: HlyD family secretion protein [Firmicutes bacterium ADurb.Bin182]|nr:MAG: HlyD family secretion protein [Firmicutes bacterium ADurb.Bin182]
MARVRVRSRFFVFILLIIVLAAAVTFLLLKNRKAGTVTSGSLKLSMPADCIIIRDEINISTEKFDKIIFRVSEAQRVESGDLVAEIFKWGYNDEVMQSLLNVQKDILNRQLLQLEGIENPELDYLNGEVEALSAKIRSVTMDEQQNDLLSLEWELKELMQKRIEYLKGSVQATEILNSLYAEEQNRQNQIEEWKSEIRSLDSGVVSFYFDGFEQVLSADKIETLNADLIKRVLKRAKAESIESENLLYRLINSSHWYCAFITPSSQAVRLTENEEYTVIFEGYYDRPYIGRALKYAVSGNDVVNVLEFNQDIGPLLSTRIAKCTLNKDAAGLKVPLSAIDIQNGIPGITVQNGDHAGWVEVNVLAADDSDAIISASAGSALISEGTGYIKR